MRLDRLIRSSLGIGRKGARRMLAAGVVEVNGRTEPDGSRMVTAFDHVCSGGRVLQSRRPRYIILHKPPGVVSATIDDQHTTVIDLVREPWADDLHLSGRLDRFTSGLVILTNDSTFSTALTLPERKVAKTYLVETDRTVPPAVVSAFQRGIYFAKEGVYTHPAEVELLASDRCRLTIFEGKHHQIKRMFARFDIKVTNLHRAAVGPLTLRGLRPGEYRQLHRDEIAAVTNKSTSG